MHYPHSRIDALSYLSIIHAHEGNWSEAEERIKIAIDTARNFSQLYRLSKVLIISGNVYALQGKFKKAVPFYMEAEQLAERSGFKQRQHTALLQLDYCFDKMGLENDWKSVTKKLRNLH